MEITKYFKFEPKRFQTIGKKKMNELNKIEHLSYKHRLDNVVHVAQLMEKTVMHVMQVNI